MLDLLPTIEVSILEATEIVPEKKLLATSSHARQQANILINVPSVSKELLRKGQVQIIGKQAQVNFLSPLRNKINIS